MKASVFAYPENEKLRSSTISILKSLIKILDSDYKIIFPVIIEDGHIVHPSFSHFIASFLAACSQTYKCVDVEWLYWINGMIKDPTDDFLHLFKSKFNLDFHFLEPFILKAKKEAKDWVHAVGAQFFVLRGLPLKPGIGVWGVVQGDFPFSVAIEITGNKESIFHEFLHQFGVSDGYEQASKSTLEGCNECWMQWQATKGKGLCKKHQDELHLFINRTLNM
jgi:hypothetical protein